MAAEGKKSGSNGSRSSSSSSSSYSSLADEIFGIKDERARSSSSSAGYFSSVFPPASGVMAKDSPDSDLYRTLNKYGRDGQVGNAHNYAAGSKSHGSSTKGETAQKDEKSIYASDSSESSYFGSSVHYGGRDFYTTSSTQTSETQKSYKNDDADMDNTNVATRGEWWQGSFYY